LRLPVAGLSELVLIRAKEGVQIDVVDESDEERSTDGPVYALFFLVSSEDNPGQHLRILAQIAGRVDDDDFMPRWVSATQEQELRETLLRDERYLSIVLERAGRTAELLGKPLRETGIPAGCLVALIRRGERTFVPYGETELREGDRLTIIGEPEGIQSLHDRFMTDS